MAVKIIFWLLAAILLAFVVVFSASNPQLVSLNLWPIAELQLPLYSVALSGALLGFILGGFAAWLQGSRSRRRARQLSRDLAAERNALTVLREKQAKLEAIERQAAIPGPPLTVA